jgi:hypothetical protein
MQALVINEILLLLDISNVKKYSAIQVKTEIKIINIFIEMTVIFSGNILIKGIIIKEIRGGFA